MAAHELCSRASLAVESVRDVGMREMSMSQSHYRRVSKVLEEKVKGEGRSARLMVDV